jgi:hypothetical protein
MLPLGGIQQWTLTPIQATLLDESTNGVIRLVMTSLEPVSCTFVDSHRSDTCVASKGHSEV